MALGLVVSGMAKALSNGQMAHATMANGAWEELKAMGNSLTPRARSTMVSGVMIKPTALAHISTTMVPNTKVNGFRTFNMEGGRKVGLTAPCSQANTKKVRRTV